MQPLSLPIINTVCLFFSGLNVPYFKCRLKLVEENKLSLPISILLLGFFCPVSKGSQICDSSLHSFYNKMLNLAQCDTMNLEIQPHFLRNLLNSANSNLSLNASI